MTNNDREMGAALQRLTDIERRIIKLEEQGEATRQQGTRTEVVVKELKEQLSGLKTSLDRSDQRRETLITEVRGIADKLATENHVPAPPPADAPQHGMPSVVAAGTAGLTAGGGLVYVAIETLKRIGLWHS